MNADGHRYMFLLLCLISLEVPGKVVAELKYNGIQISQRSPRNLRDMLL